MPCWVSRSGERRCECRGECRRVSEGGAGVCVVGVEWRARAGRREGRRVEGEYMCVEKSIVRN